MKQGCCLLMLMMLLIQPITGACKPQADVSLYFPMDANLVWTYTGEGSEYADFSRRVEFVQGDRAQMSEYDGGTRKMIIFQAAPESVNITFSQVEVYEDKNFLQEMPNQSGIVLKAPLSAGSVWKDAKDRREILSTTARITVPAGSFENVLIVKITPLAKETGESYHRLEYYAAGTGLIMREFIGKNDFKVVSKLKYFGKNRNCETLPPK